MMSFMLVSSDMFVASNCSDLMKGVRAKKTPIKIKIKVDYKFEFISASASSKIS